MTKRFALMCLAPAAGLVALGSLILPTSAQVPAPPTHPGRFEFLVVESFDARYEGDTPGHMGRGSSGRSVPRLALGDAVKRGDGEAVGVVTHLTWNEARQGLEVEFKPDSGKRVALGDPVWIAYPTDHAP